MTGKKSGGTSGRQSLPSGLKVFLDAGGMLLGSVFEAGAKNLTDMSDGAAKRHGYMKPDGSWTDRGYSRATKTDYDRLEIARNGLRRLSEED